MEDRDEVGRLNKQLLSKLTLGTMRFSEKNLSVKDVTLIIDKCFESGITSHHSSAEYESYLLYVESLKKSPFRDSIHHICKLSSPHFEESSFSPISLEQKIDQELVSLNIERIDVVQWLVRSQPINDEDRITVLNEQQEDINAFFKLMKQKGKIKDVYSFPYSLKFAEQVKSLEEIDGICSYLNIVENEYSSMASVGDFIAIRPLFAGRLLDNEINLDDAMSFVLSHEKVKSIIVSINSTQRLEEVVALKLF